MTVNDIMDDIVASKPGDTRAEKLWSALVDMSGGHPVNAAIDAVDLFNLAVEKGFIQWSSIGLRHIPGEGGFTLAVGDTTIEMMAKDAPES